MCTQEEAVHVLAFYGQGGYKAGGYITDLLQAMSHADPGHLRKLELGYPGYVAAVCLYRYHYYTGGPARLRAIAGPLAGRLHDEPPVFTDWQAHATVNNVVHWAHPSTSGRPHRGVIVQDEERMVKAERTDGEPGDPVNYWIPREHLLDPEHTP